MMWTMIVNMIVDLHQWSSVKPELLAPESDYKYKIMNDILFKYIGSTVKAAASMPNRLSNPSPKYFKRKVKVFLTSLI
jgi:hypothetical protein